VWMSACVYPLLCVHILVLGGKKAGGKFTQSPSDERRNVHTYIYMYMYVL